MNAKDTIRISVDPMIARRVRNQFIMHRSRAQVFESIPEGCPLECDSCHEIYKHMDWYIDDALNSVRLFPHDYAWEIT